MLSLHRTRAPQPPHTQANIQHIQFLNADGTPVAELDAEDELAFLSLTEDTFQSAPVIKTAQVIKKPVVTEKELLHALCQEAMLGNPNMPFTEISGHTLHHISARKVKEFAQKLLANHLIARKIKKIKKQFKYTAD